LATKGGGAGKAPLNPKIYKKTVEDVELGVQLYKTRHAPIFYIEFNIINKHLPRTSKFPSPSTPIFTRRLVNINVRRADGSHPDYPFDNNHPEQLDYVREQIIEQGGRIFRHVHSMAALLRASRGEVPEVPIEKGNEPYAQELAGRIEDFLSSQKVRTPN
jgi:hypothetical protein